MRSKDPRPGREAVADIGPEEESFIRAIVGAPGDDAPRLAYADWLDARSDPRARWLRAELFWAAPWRTGKPPPNNPELQALALELDAGWLARVSRPPFGVCCDHIAIKPGKVPLVGADVDRAAASLDVTFRTSSARFSATTTAGAAG